jgi:hypothetical protein
MITYVGRHDVEDVVIMLERLKSIFCYRRAHDVGAQRFAS